MPLQSVIDANKRGRMRGVFMCDAFDGGFCNSSDLAHARRRILLDALFESIKTDRVSVDVILILKAVANNDMHHGKRQRAISARHNRYMLVGLIPGTSAQRIDGDNLCAARTRLQDVPPEVDVRGDD